MEKSVTIAVPVAESVQPIVLQSMLSVVSYATAKGIKIVDIGVSQREMIDCARNGFTEAFLETNVEWMFWMDSDMTFPKETLVELFRVAEEKDAKLVTGIYYQRKGKHLPVLWTRGVTTESGDIAGLGTKKSETNKYVGSFTFPHPDKKEAFPVHAAGFGCVLVHRSVMEKMERPWFKFIPGVCSEDFYFFVNAKELGYTAWACPTLTLGHIGDPPVITKHDFIRKGNETNGEIDPLVYPEEKVARETKNEVA